MGEILHNNPVLDDARNKRRSIIFDLDVDADACPDETFVLTGVPGDVVIVRHAEDTATSDAVEDITCDDTGFTTPVNATGIIGFLLDASKLEASSTSILKVHAVKLLGAVNEAAVCCGVLVDAKDTISFVGADQTQGLVVSPSGISAGGNIVFELDSTVDFDATDYHQTIEVIYSIR